MRAAKSHSEVDHRCAETIDRLSVEFAKALGDPKIVSRIAELG